MALWRTFLIVITVFLFWAVQIGCAPRYIRLGAQAGECLNPTDHYCNEYGTNSILMAVKVYQLKRQVDITSLDWEKFLVEGQDFAILEDYLADPEDLAVVRTHFTITAGDAYKKIKIKRRLRTRYLLVVTLGRESSDLSIAQTVVPWGYRGRQLCFEYYDVMALKRRCDSCEFHFEAAALESPTPDPASKGP